MRIKHKIDCTIILSSTGTVIMPNEMDSGGEESPGVLSDDHDHPPDSPDSNSTDPPDTNKGFPWLKVICSSLKKFRAIDALSHV